MYLSLVSMVFIYSFFFISLLGGDHIYVSILSYVYVSISGDFIMGY